MFLRGGDLVIGPAFGPLLALMDFVRASVQGPLVVFSDRVAIAADRKLARLCAQPRLTVAGLTA